MRLKKHRTIFKIMRIIIKMQNGDTYAYKNAILTLRIRPVRSGSSNMVYYFTSDSVIEEWKRSGFDAADGTQLFLGGSEESAKKEIADLGATQPVGGKRRRYKATKRARRNRNRYSRRS